MQSGARGSRLGGWTAPVALLALVLACEPLREAASLERAAPEPSAGRAAPWEPPDFGAEYRAHWDDGNAELAGYALSFPRYGEIREGTAVAIFVTEPFDNAARVKPEGSAAERFGAFKLNLLQELSTGIYDYNLMTSAFIQVEPVNGRPPGALSKLSFSSQDWCGHVYHQALFDADGVRTALHSYFEGEADATGELEYPVGGFAEDALILWARGLAGPRIEPAETVTVPLLRSLLDSRLLHLPVVWDEASLSRSARLETVEVPAGRFQVNVLRAQVTRQAGRKTYPAGASAPAETRTWTFYVEPAFPHRLVRWTRDDGLDARLAGSARLPYWKLSGKGQEALLAKIGLRPRAPRAP